MTTCWKINTTLQLYLIRVLYCKSIRVRFMVFNATFNKILSYWQPVLLVGETRIPGEHHRPVVCHGQHRYYLEVIVWTNICNRTCLHFKWRVSMLNYVGFYPPNIELFTFEVTRVLFINLSKLRVDSLQLQN